MFITKNALAKLIGKTIDEVTNHHVPTLRIVDIEDLNEFLDTNISASMESHIRYEQCIVITFNENPFGGSGGHYLVEGFKTDDQYETQTISRYSSETSGICRWSRSKLNGVWNNWKKEQ